MRPLSLGSSDKPRFGLWRRVLTLALLLLPVALYLAGRSEDRSTVVGRVAAACTAPLQRGITYAGDAISLTWQRYIALYYIAIENEGLRKQNARLTGQLVTLEELRLENERLRRLLRLQEDLSMPAATGAKVIALSPVPAFRSVRLDKGHADGIAIGDAVVAATGLVGRIASLSEHTADVLLLVDAGSSVDALVQRSRARVRVRGEGGDASFGLDAQYLERTADVEPGDLLLTSGLGRTFPKGLPVGRVRGVERRAFGLYQRAIVQPSVDVTTLEDVLVTPLQSAAVRVALEAAGDP